MKKIKKFAHLLPILIIVLSALAKIGGISQPSEDLPMPQMANKLLPILLLELTCIFLFIIPKFRLIGFFLMCSYLGGAIAVSYVTGLARPVIPAFALSLFWVSMYLQRAELFKLQK